MKDILYKELDAYNKMVFLYIKGSWLKIYRWKTLIDKSLVEDETNCILLNYDEELYDVGYRISDIYYSNNTEHKLKFVVARNSGEKDVYILCDRSEHKYSFIYADSYYLEELYDAMKVASIICYDKEEFENEIHEYNELTDGKTIEEIKIIRQYPEHSTTIRQINESIQDYLSLKDYS